MPDAQTDRARRMLADIRHRLEQVDGLSEAAGIATEPAAYFFHVIRRRTGDNLQMVVFGWVSTTGQGAIIGLNPACVLQSRYRAFVPSNVLANDVGHWLGGELEQIFMCWP